MGRTLDVVWGGVGIEGWLGIFDRKFLFSAALYRWHLTTEITCMFQTQGPSLGTGSACPEARDHTAGRAAGGAAADR